MMGKQDETSKRGRIITTTTANKRRWCSNKEFTVLGIVVLLNIFVIIFLFNFELNVTERITRNMIMSDDGNIFFQLPQHQRSLLLRQRSSSQETSITTTNSTPLLVESLLDGIGTWDPAEEVKNITKIVWMKWNSNKLPLLVQEHIHEMKKQNPTYEFKLVNDIDAELFIKDHFPTIVYETYQSIHPNLKAAKTDFWRYCVLYLYGGIFIDLDAKIIKPLEEWIQQDDDTSAILSFDTEFYNFCKSNTKCHCHGIWDALGLDAYPKLLKYRNGGGGGGRNNNNNDDDDGKPHLITQWAMVFPRPYHPILKEVILYMMVLLHRYRDQEEQKNNPLLRHNFEMQSKIICTTGPGMFSAAVTRAFEKYNSTYLQTRFTEQPKYKGLIYHADPLIKKILNGQHTHYLKIGRSHPLMMVTVPDDGKNSSSLSSSSSSFKRSKIDETGYFEQASLPGLKKKKNQ